MGVAENKARQVTSPTDGGSGWHAMGCDAMGCDAMDASGRYGI